MTCYYLAKVVLREQINRKVILKNGDVMELADANKDEFIEIDVRNVSEIAVGAKKARLLSPHPEGSYEIVKGEDGLAIVKILDAQNFWSVTRYLVIRVR